jgi:endonuclease/exonuclease/phosphatase family metal-dependent hydrolase
MSLAVKNIDWILIPRWVALAAAAILILGQGCRAGPPKGTGIAEAPEVYSQVIGSNPEDVFWSRPAGGADLRELNAWRSAVGPILLSQPAIGLEAPTLDSLAIVSWNTGVGAGDVGDLIRDLRSGNLTGGSPVIHYVLLLQEVFRDGPAVPTEPPARSKWASRIERAQEDGERKDIGSFASAHRLGVFYVPSMRNGPPEDAAAAEDRGSAIVSTLPLEGCTAVELPMERQRRVSILAELGARTTDGRPWLLVLANVHLENRAHWGDIHKTPGHARLRQVEHLIDVLPDGNAMVVGGDFNTWFLGAGEPAITLMKKHFILPADSPEVQTGDAPAGFPDRRLDYVFFKLPPGWSGRYSVIDNTYGSDHRPLVGWVVVGGSGD